MTRPTTMLALLLITTGCHERGQSVSMSAEPTPAEADAMASLDSGSMSPGGDAGPTRLTQDGEVVSPSPPAGQAMNGGDSGGASPAHQAAVRQKVVRPDECVKHGDLTSVLRSTGSDRADTTQENVFGILIEDSMVTPDTLVSAIAWADQITAPDTYCEKELRLTGVESCEETNTIPERLRRVPAQLSPVPIDGGLWVPCYDMTNIVVRYAVEVE